MDNNTRWTAVVARDAAADGTFVYCVKTTKIFCRPNCKARLARRANVEFFETPTEAQAAGYRSCKRCQPLLSSYTPEADKIRKVCTMIQTLPFDAPLPGLERLAQEAGLTKHHFHRLFKRETGLTPREYAIATRRESLSDPSDSCATMTPLTPFTPYTNSTAMPIIADKELLAFLDVDQTSPDQIKHASEEFKTFVIFYDIVETTFGVLLVAFQNGQICKIELGASDAELLEGLELSFSAMYHLHAPLELATAEEAASFRQQINAVVEALEQPSGKVLDVPVTLALQAEPGVIT